jgi:hypothetical protein
MRFFQWEFEGLSTFEAIFFALREVLSGWLSLTGEPRKIRNRRRNPVAVTGIGARSTRAHIDRPAIMRVGTVTMFGHPIIVRAFPAISHRFLWQCAHSTE